MTRVLSGAVLVAITVLVVWYAGSLPFFLVGEALLLLALVEYADLARASGAPISLVASGLSATLVCASFASIVFRRFPWVSADIILMGAVVGLGATTLSRWREGTGALAMAAAAIFPSLYLGLPIGAMVAIRETRGREALGLLILTIAVSDTAQLYTGRAFGRRLLSPTISPKKTIAGAVGGFVAGAIVLVVTGIWWLPSVWLPFRAILGVMIVTAGIAGDLFESMLKRSAGVKDSSRLIPGHGGILDRIDALLFAAPIYYVVLRYI